MSAGILTLAQSLGHPCHPFNGHPLHPPFFAQGEYMEQITVKTLFYIYTSKK